MKKVIYFTAGPNETSGETAEINAIKALAAAPFQVVVRNGLLPLESGGADEAADYVAGTPPAPYDDGEDYPVFDPDAPPPSDLPGTMAIVADGQAIAATVTGTYVDTVTLTVVDGVVTAVALS